MKEYEGRENLKRRKEKGRGWKSLRIECQSDVGESQKGILISTYPTQPHQTINPKYILKQ